MATEDINKITRFAARLVDRANAEMVTALENQRAMHVALEACERIFLKGIKATTDVEWDEAYGLVNTALHPAARGLETTDG